MLHADIINGLEACVVRKKTLRCGIELEAGELQVREGIFEHVQCIVASWIDTGKADESVRVEINELTDFFV